MRRSVARGALLRHPCATCGEPVHFDGSWGWAHEEPSRIYGHVARVDRQEVTDA